MTSVIGWTFLCSLLSAEAAPASPEMLIVVGAVGSEEFEKPFHEWAERWTKAAKQANVKTATIGQEAAGAKSDRELLQARLDEQSRRPGTPFWLILIGHGTYDGKLAKFNLRGTDVSSTELNEWLRKIDAPVALINCASSSGPFLVEASGPKRIVITATKSGSEFNFAHFGDFLSSAIVDAAADLDKDEQTSLLEAFLLANSRLREFYSRDGRLATEHPLLDDNGDRLGTPADWFQGLRPAKESKTGALPDGVVARQFVLLPSPREAEMPSALRERRDALERKLAELRQRKASLAESAYFRELEPILVELARIGEESAKTSKSSK